MASQINMASIWVRVAKSSSANNKFKQAATARAEEVFTDAVIGLQKEFEESPVTQEIDGGISSSNISETLLGGPAPQNLYSFIGFPNNEAGLPTDPIRERLDPEHEDGPKLIFNGKTGVNTTNYKFKIKGPDLKAIYSKTPLPWAKSMSWAQKIEGRIPGFAHFLAKFWKKENSRSGGGIQVDATVRAATYRPPRGGYIQTMVGNFFTRVKQYGKFNQGGWRKRYKAM